MTKMISRHLFGALWIVLFSSAQASDETIHAGEKSYQLNCMACHQIDSRSVGPSLVAMAEVYPEFKRAEFIEWAQNPGKKDPRMIQMPSMAHVSPEVLGQIHDYVIKITDGKVEKRGAHQFPPFKEPKRKLPYVVRAFLPYSSPASIAVVLKQNMSVCWDTEACAFRYAWEGNRTALVKWRDVADLRAEPYYRETAGKFWKSGIEGESKYLGYRLINDCPEFHYKIGDVEIRELIKNAPKDGEIQRTFTLSPMPQTLQIDLTHEGEGVVSSNVGTRDQNILSLGSDDGNTFTLTISKP